MKQGQSLVTFVMAVLAGALAIYFGYYVFSTFNDPYSTTAAYSYTATDSARADGLLIREEQVIPGQGGIADVTRGEGEKVGIGQTIALVYQNAQAQASQAELENIASEIAVLEAATAGGGTPESAASLDETILESVVALRGAASLGDYNNLEDTVTDIKSNILRRSYTYGEGVTLADLAAILGGLTSQYNALRQQTSAVTTSVRASVSGIFSGWVDGYESTLTPESALTLTPSSLKAALESNPAPTGNEIGKLLTDDRWYFAANFPEETADRLEEGKTATIKFSGDFDQEVDMRIDAISDAENGEKTVVFSSDRFLARTTLLRKQTAELIFESWTGLRIPKTALRMEEYTYTPEDSSEEVQGTRLGVYAVVAGRVEFKAVDVVMEGEDFYVVRPASTGSKALRAGDNVLYRGTGFYDGELLEY